MAAAGLVVATAIAGLFFGRFAALAADRIPDRRPLLHDLNACPACGAATSFAYRVPLVGAALGARCKNCGARVPARYAAMEVVTALLFALAAARFRWHLETVVYAALFWVLLVLSVIDLQHRLLPDRVVYPAILAGAAALIVAAIARGEVQLVVHAAIGAAIFGGFLFVVAFINPAGMGGGDVKLSFLLGMFLGYLDGWGVVLVGMFLSFLCAGLVGVVAMVVSKAGRKTHLPFGPFLVLGTVIAIFLGHPILNAYLD